MPAEAGIQSDARRFERFGIRDPHPYMTPAVLAAQRAGIPFRLHSYGAEPDAASYGLEAAEKLGLPADRVFKTLLVKLDGRQSAVAVVPVTKSLDLKACGAAFGVKRAAMATVAEAERATGYVIGGISPLGQRKRLPTVVDESALHGDRIVVSAGRRGLEIELAPADLLRLCSATTARITR